MRTMLILAAAAVVLSGCGRMGELESPHRETERAPRSAGAPALPEPATINRPSSQQAIEGGPSNPIGGTAAGREPQ
jgi:predicted small lipoprotein YifL